MGVKPVQKQKQGLNIHCGRLKHALHPSARPLEDSVGIGLRSDAPARGLGACLAPARLHMGLAQAESQCLPYCLSAKRSGCTSPCDGPFDLRFRLNGLAKLYFHVDPLIQKNLSSIN